MIKKLLLLNCLFVVVVITTYKKAQAQTIENKEMKTSIIINGGDTTINGKNFKNLSEEEKTELRKEFTQVEKRRISMNSPRINTSISKIRKKSADNDSLILVTDSTRMRKFSYTIDGNAPKVFEFWRDTLVGKLDGTNMEREIILGRNLGEDIDWEMVHPRRVASGRPSINSGYTMTLPASNKPNSNTFNYSTTDKDGFTTNITYTVAEPSKTDLNSTFKDEKINVNGLNISDVMLIPNFTSGKTTLTFSTKAKGVLNIKLMDSAGTTLFSDNKTLIGELYSNSFSVAKNGNYFLHITQGSQTFIRKVTLIRN